MLRGVEKVAIVGGSIAGLATGVSLRQRGYPVTIFESASKPHVGRGSGIVLPAGLVEECIENDLFDSTIPCYKIPKRSFLTRDVNSHHARQLWKHPLFLVTFNWNDIYSNLLKRFPKSQCLYGKKVFAVTQDKKQCYVETNDSSVYEFDRVIGADGIGSVVRNMIFPDVKPHYADYIAWRGLIDDPVIVNHEMFDETVPFYMFENGHLLMYKIPGEDYANTSNMILNWVMYEYCKNKPLSEFLIDKEGVQHNVSVSSGMLREENITHLHQFAQQKLPLSVAKLICETKNPFIQAVFDYLAPDYVKERICLLGDAANTLRPHSASGLATALKGAMSLAEAMDFKTRNVKSLLNWGATQSAMAHGQAMVTEPPDWEKMTEEDTQDWWKSIMQGKRWYPLYSDGQTFTQQRDVTENMQELYREFGKLNLSESNISSKIGKPR